MFKSIKYLVAGAILASLTVFSFGNLLLAGHGGGGGGHGMGGGGHGMGGGGGHGMGGGHYGGHYGGGHGDHWNGNHGWYGGYGGGYYPGWSGGGLYLDTNIGDGGNYNNTYPDYYDPYNQYYYNSYGY